MMKEINTTKGQTLTDIALQEYGNAEALFEIVENNPALLNDFGDDEQTVEDVTQLDLAYPLHKNQKIIIDTESDLVNRAKLSELKGQIIISE
jgi:nucleoid-associated protein YgaU